MRPISSGQRWFAAAVCVLATYNLATAEEGVVRISDAAGRPGVVRMGGPPQAPPGTAWRQSVYSPDGNGAMMPARQEYGQGTSMSSPYQQAAWSAASGPCDCIPDGCDPGMCPDYNCDSWNCDSGYNCDDCDYESGHRRRMLTLCAKAAPKGSLNGARYPKRWWRGQQANYHARNQRLSNTLFGWLVPSGCGGQGCPPVGKYQITYADQPDYADPQDGMAYGAQGYGIPVSVPLAPNVRQAYNYSWGTPSSRITQIGQYDPQTTPQPLYRQTW